MLDVLKCFLLVINTAFSEIIHKNDFNVWGPGLKPHIITMPARYFFMEPISTNTSYLFDDFSIEVKGVSKGQHTCRIWTDVLRLAGGRFIVRYKLYEVCENINISLLYRGEHIANSPYKIDNIVYFDGCDCPRGNLDTFLLEWECGGIPSQISKDLSLFENVDFDSIREKIISKYNNPGAVSLCHYIIKANKMYRKCYGKYVGFKIFADSILLSLTRKTTLPDLEFFINLGDWPLVKSSSDVYPIFSWCGSRDTYDIVLPTYDVTESSLENMGRVMLDMLSVQGNAKVNWNDRIPKVFWRGRDSNRERLKLIELSQENPAMFNVSLTNFFFFRDEQDKYGPKTEHVSFFKFFDKGLNPGWHALVYEGGLKSSRPHIETATMLNILMYKFQINLDGTVAAYRLPYLLAGGSLVMKQASKYYEHFYSDLEPNIHYIPIKRDLSDLMDKVHWALDNDEKAKLIADNAQSFANQNLLPRNIFCYHAHLLNEFSKKITSSIEVFPDMEVENSKETKCVCHTKIKEEL